MGEVLNYIWALLSLWMLIRWLWRSSAGKSAGRLGLCGLVCTLTLLFPVISDNDDLLQREFCNAPVSAVLKSQLKAKTACDSGTTAVQASSGDLRLSRCVLGRISADTALFPPVWLHGSTGVRSPPRFS